MIINFIGQERAIARLRVLALGRTNVLLRASFGMGKTELCRWYCFGLDHEYMEHTCTGSPLLPPPGVGVVFLDEIHRLRPEEPWYKFGGTLVGATTEGAPISAPLMSRMVTIWLEPYSYEHIYKIVSSRCPLPDHITRVIANRTRGVPRLAINLANEIKAWIKYHNYTPQNEVEAGELIRSLGYHERGLTDQDLQYLNFLKDQGTASLETIARGLNMPREMIEVEIESYLIRLGLIKITAKGRSLYP